MKWYVTYLICSDGWTNGLTSFIEDETKVSNMRWFVALECKWNMLCFGWVFCRNKCKGHEFHKIHKDNWLCPCAAKLSLLGYVPFTCLTKYIWYWSSMVLVVDTGNPSWRSPSFYNLLTKPTEACCFFYVFLLGWKNTKRTFTKEHLPTCNLSWYLFSTSLWDQSMIYCSDKFVGLNPR